MSTFEYLALFFIFLMILVGLMILSAVNRLVKEITGKDPAVISVFSRPRAVCYEVDKYNEAWEGDPDVNKRIETMRH